MKTTFLTTCFVALIFTSCGPRPGGLPDSKPCDLSNTKSTASETYTFNSDFGSYFSQSTRWESHSADIQIVNGKGQLTADSEDVSNALEAWKLYKDQMPYDKSWEFSVWVDVPTYWNSNGGKDAQVGIGLYAGRPVENGESPKVYECNLAAINGEVRFVQAQLIKNRLGYDPDDVQFKKLDKSKAKAKLTIQYCANYNSLGLFIDDEQVGKSKSIGKGGVDDWELDSNGKIDVGIMGFAENTVITNNSPIVEKVTVTVY
ncbi:hypothetical protein [Ulvibacterium sp.]|uniref:hypothetical protein n=1 Tax=Ulvibacterium sp. TaxID=2665914 RepID=UPI00263687C0|nr:hypothetical protein [Ulvibacterium sp.]